MISSLRNPAVRMYKQSVTRGLPNFVPLEGVRLVEDALTAGIPIDTLYLSEGVDTSVDSIGGRILSQARQKGARVTIVTRSVAERMADTRTPQGVFALARWEPLSGAELFARASEAESPSFVVFLDGVSDPGNVGTIVRTAAALGAMGVATGPGCAGLTNPKVVRASMGSMFRIPVAQIREVEAFLAHIAELGCEVIASDAETGVDIESLSWPDYRKCGEEQYSSLTLHGAGSADDSLKGPADSVGGSMALLVVGSEAAGVSDAVRSHATSWVKIDMAREVESLNVAAAAAILIYSLHRKILACEHGG